MRLVVGGDDAFDQHDLGSRAARGGDVAQDAGGGGVVPVVLSRAAATNSRNGSAASRRTRSAGRAATARLRRVAHSRSASTLRGTGELSRA